MISLVTLVTALGTIEVEDEYGSFALSRASYDFAIKLGNEVFLEVTVSHRIEQENGFLWWIRRPKTVVSLGIGIDLAKRRQRRAGTGNWKLCLTRNAAGANWQQVLPRVGEP